jgi:hypothetical protein
MIVHGWKAGTYGIRISKKDRDKIFEQGWKSVFLTLDDEETIQVNISDYFWRNCIELRSKKIGEWFKKYNKAPWNRGCPPRMEMEQKSGNRFKVNLMS